MDLAKSHPVPGSGAKNGVLPIAPSGSHSRSHRTGRRQHSKRSKHVRSLQLINLLLALALIVVFIGWINTWVNYNATEAERVELATQLRHKNSELERLQIHNAELNTNLSALVQQRLPNLQELQFDTTLPIDRGYARNISFTRTGVEQRWQYEYSLVLENRSRDIVKPNVRILLFDESGIQTGGTKIIPKAATSNSHMEFLEPAEIRAYTDEIPSDSVAPPRYFQVRLK